MPSSYTASCRFEAQFTGENINSWGLKLSNTLARIDDAIAGYVAITVTGDTSLTSSNDNSTQDQARRAHLKLNGSPASNFTVTIPPVSKSYKVWNNTSKVATFSTGSGTTVTIDAGDILDLWSDGANVKTTTFGGYALKDYITAQTATAGAVPGVAGHAGKFLYTDGVSAYWKQAQTTDLGDYQANIIGKQIALAVSL